MHLTEIRINLCPGGNASRLKAFCSLTFDNTFVVRDVKLIDGHDGLFVAMPSRKLADHCPRCTEKNHLRAKFCNQCGQRLDPERASRSRNAMAMTMRPKLHVCPHSQADPTLTSAPADKSKPKYKGKTGAQILHEMLVSITKWTPCSATPAARSCRSSTSSIRPPPSSS
jgi:stage V sporulation protein G